MSLDQPRAYHPDPEPDMTLAHGDNLPFKKERAWHVDRWQRHADRINRQLRKHGSFLEVTGEDVMMEEVAWEKKARAKYESQEYQDSDKRLKEFIADWKAALNAAKEGTPDKDFVLAVWGTGAGLASAYGVGQDMFLEDKGYSKLITHSVGSSGASGPALFRMTGEARRGASLFMNECMTDEFLKMHGILGDLRPMLHTPVISGQMRVGPKEVSKDKLAAAFAEGRSAYAIITDKKTGIPQLVNMSLKDNQGLDPILFLEASSAIPGMEISSITIDGEAFGGREFVDGAFADAPPLSDILKLEPRPTHLLLQPNRPFDLLSAFANTPYEQYIVDAMEKARSITQRKNAISKLIYSGVQMVRMKERVGEILKLIEQEKGIKIAVLWPPDEELDILEKNPDTMRRAILGAYRKACADFGEEQPEDIKFLEDQEDEPATMASEG